jgi:hypothetical protein
VKKERLIMIASKLIITQETREKLNNPVLSPTKKRELRERMIKDKINNSIDSKFTKQELVVAAGFNPITTTNEYANGLGLVNSMVKRHIIMHNNTTEFRKVWTVIDNMKVTPTPKQVAGSVVKKEPVVVLSEKTELDKVTLVDMAKEFSWRENSDSLRNFIAYMHNTIK